MNDEKIAEKYLTLDALSDAQKVMASWVAEHFSRTGRWPRESDAIVEAYDRGVTFDEITRVNDVFGRETHDREPPDVVVVPWVLYDAGGCAQAFTIAFQAYTAALAEVHRTRKEVLVSKADLAQLHNIDEIVLRQIGYLFEKASVINNRRD